MRTEKRNMSKDRERIGSESRERNKKAEKQSAGRGWSSIKRGM